MRDKLEKSMVPWFFVASLHGWGTCRLLLCMTILRAMFDYSVLEYFLVYKVHIVLVIMFTNFHVQAIWVDECYLFTLFAK